jgi:FkbM family methyltransferase
MNGAGFKLVAKRLLQGLGLELRRLKYLNSEETVLAHLFAATRIDVVLDIGANTGQYARLLRSAGFAGTIISFEAIPQVHAELKNASAADSRWLVAPCAALGSRRGTVEIHIAGNSAASSSLLPMHAAHLEAAPESQYIGTQLVQLERLDELAPPLLADRGPVLLKIDTQGYEKEVLRGSTGLLGSVAVIQLEMSLTPLYGGAPGFAEMILFMTELGFELFSMVPGLRNHKTGRLLQADGFFVRPTS